MNTVGQLNETCRGIAIKIGNYLKSQLARHKGFGERSFYGEAFSLALLAVLKELDSATLQTLTSCFRTLDTKHPEFHWEFNRYALYHYAQLTGDHHFDDIVYDGTFKGTRCTNWSLLRCATRLHLNPRDHAALDEATQITHRAQSRSGLILDEPHVKSFQYHCFSLAMLVEIFAITSDPSILASFDRGMCFIRHFILSEGESLYVGRGQEQSFGYGALAYCLATAYRLQKDSDVLSDLKRVLTYLRGFQRPNGSFPLVLNHEEPSGITYEDLPPPGWYSYNNFFDYLPFFGYFVAKAAEQLSLCPDTDFVPEENVLRDYRDENYLVIHRPYYEAVVARPGGATPNDLAMPYLVAKGRPILPCYGGEQELDNRYALWNLPLPRFPHFQKTIRQKAIAKLTANGLIMASPLGAMRRRYQFDSDKITVHTRVFSPFVCEHPIAIFSDVKQISPRRFIGDGYEIECNRSLSPAGTTLCAKGVLNLFSTKSRSLMVTIKITP